MQSMGLVKNSKFFYDPLYNFKQFIYYDGDINFTKFKSNNCNDSNYQQFTKIKNLFTLEISIFKELN